MNTSPVSPPQQIVVGFDGSPGAIAALDWAASEAERWGTAELLVAYAWTYPGLAYPHDPPTPPPTDTLPPDRLAGAARRVLDSHRSVPVRYATTEGDPGRTLTALSRTAELLVVGRRRRYVPGLPLGSVSRHCAAHAACPVVTVPPPQQHESV